MTAVSNKTRRENFNAASDEELVQTACAAPEAAVRSAAASEVLQRYTRSVYIWCYRFTRNHERAMDLSQDVLMQAFQSLHAFEGRARFSSWLFAIARNRCLNEMRRVPLLADSETDPEGFPSGNVPQDQWLEETEDEARLLALIRATLEPHEQRAIWLRCVERMPVDDITRVLDLGGRSGARAVLQTARRKLRTALERRKSED
jgi:RNA polymerase sigma-70 factor (ECF subfamily)